MGRSWIEDLNPAQRRAATHPGGPVLVIAGAGTGKTRTLACRVAWLIEQGVSPDRILLLTFTRRAAAEMLERAGRFTDQNSAGKVWGGTFHAVASRVLRQHGRALGLSPEFTVMDQADAADMMNLIRGDLGLAQGKRRFPQKNTLIALYSRMVNSRTKLSDVARHHFPWCQEDLDGVRQIYEQYTRRKREQNILDYDDLLLFWNALCASPGTGDLLAARFDHILVDEYQDTNLIQSEILQAMRRPLEGERRNVMVVGDDAQSIYSFRAATVRNILDFPQQFPGAEIVTLEQNYRSTQGILDASNRVMSDAKERYTKNLFSDRGPGRKPGLVTCLDEAEQCREVCTGILARLEEGLRLKRQAVLFRAGHHSSQLEIELTRRNIPFVKYGGLKFVEAAHVKDLLAILRILENPYDELSWYRILQLFEGVGPAAARRIIAALLDPAGGNSETRESGNLETRKLGNSEIGELGSDSFPSSPISQFPSYPLHRLIQAPPHVPPAAEKEFAAFRAAMEDCSTGELGAAAQIERIRKFYEPVFRRVYENPEARLRDLDQLEQIAGRYGSRGQFITDLTLDPPASTQDFAGPPLLEEDYLILSTIHSAKGCEWDSVSIIHASDGMIPSDMATGSEEEIEEERRLLYVAMTRARDTLTIYFPLRYYDRPRGRSDRHGYGQLTRFIPHGALLLFELRGGNASPPQEEHPEETAAGTPAAVDRMLNELWS